MRRAITLPTSGVSLKTGHALRTAAIALGSILLIAALTIELFGIAIAAK